MWKWSVVAAVVAVAGLAGQVRGAATVDGCPQPTTLESPTKFSLAQGESRSFCYKVSSEVAKSLTFFVIPCTGQVTLYQNFNETATQSLNSGVQQFPAKFPIQVMAGFASPLRPLWSYHFTVRAPNAPNPNDLSASTPVEKNISARFWVVMTDNPSWFTNTVPTPGGNGDVTAELVEGTDGQNSSVSMSFSRASTPGGATDRYELWRRDTPLPDSAKFPIMACGVNESLTLDQGVTQALAGGASKVNVVTTAMNGLPKEMATYVIRLVRTSSAGEWSTIYKPVEAGGSAASQVVLAVRALVLFAALFVASLSIAA